MHTPSLFVASVALLSTFAVAEVERPKFYFPRQVKRQVFDNKSTPKQSTPKRHVIPSTPKRDNILSEIANGIFPQSPADATGDLSSATSSTDSSTDQLTTVIISSTVFAGDSTTPTASADSTATTSSSDGGLLGIIPTSAPAILPTATAATTSSDSTPTSDSTSDATSTSDSLTGDSTTSDSSTDSTDATSTASGILPGLSTLLNPTAASSTTSSDASGTTATDATITSGTTASATSSASVDPLSSIISGITGSGTAVTTTAPSSTVSGSDTLSSILSSFTSSLGSAPTTTPGNETTPVETGSSTVIATLPTITSSGISFSATATGVSVTGTGVPTLSSTASATVNGTAALTGTPVPTTSLPVTVNTSGISPPVSTGAITSTGALPSNGTTVAASPTPDNESRPLSTPPVSISNTATAQVTIPQTTSADTSIPPQTILPTGTNTATTDFVPSAITFAPSPTQSSATTTETGIPTALPKVIAPPNGFPDVPKDNTLIQIGFQFPLNYQFVVSEWRSQVQIFQFLPDGIAAGLGTPLDNIKMHSLVPYDTTSTNGFITTLAMAYVPSNLVNNLQASIHTPLSPLYQNSDNSVSTMMNLINPAIAILPGSTLPDGGSSGTNSGASPTSTAGNGDDGIFNTNQQAQTGAKKAGTLAGVISGAVAATAAYGAAMFFIARRYKRKRSLHRRSSSIVNPAEMRQTGSPALMGGALMSGGRMTPGTGPNDRNSRGSGKSNGNSARTAQISAPMMAENSLGWN